MNERAILRALKDGEVSALSAVIDCYTPYVFAVVSNVLGDKLPREDAEEIVSDSFVKLWYTRDNVKNGSLKAYLAVIARNAAISRLRSLHIWEPLEDDVPIVECRQPEASAILRELEDIARDAVESLPPPDDEIFTRHYFLCQTAERMGEDMGINPATVRTKLRRGMEKLRDYLEERGFSHENIYD